MNNLSYKIKIVFDIIEKQYIVFVDGIKNIQGFGDTEQEAIDDFNKTLQRKLME